MKRLIMPAIAFLILLNPACCFADEPVSVFVGTDRHAHYESRFVETEEEPAPPEGGSVKPQSAEADSANAKPGAEKGAIEKEGTEKGATEPKGRRMPQGKIVPVFDSEGNLIWHNDLTAVLELVAEDPDAVLPEMVFLGGDHVGSGGHNMMDGLGNPIGAPFYSTEGIDTQIRSVFGEDVRTLYTYGTHDINEVGNYEDGFLCGPKAENGYYVYGISYAQMAFDTEAQIPKGEHPYTGKDLADPFGACAETASHHFLMWVNDLKDHLPIIVFSHVPLHAERRDNPGAWTWVRALNDASRDHDIIFLWGHNHTMERRDKKKELERSCYLRLPGEKLAVQTWGLEKDPEAAVVQEELQFIYLNAGYIVNGVGTLLTFTDTDDSGDWDTLTAKRYALNEENRAFGSTGITSPWVFDLRQWEE